MRNRLGIPLITVSASHSSHSSIIHYYISVIRKMTNDGINTVLIHSFIIPNRFTLIIIFYHVMIRSSPCQLKIFGGLVRIVSFVPAPAVPWRVFVDVVCE